MCVRSRLDRQELEAEHRLRSRVPAAPLTAGSPGAAVQTGGRAPGAGQRGFPGWAEGAGALGSEGRERRRVAFALRLGVEGGGRGPSGLEKRPPKLSRD